MNESHVARLYEYKYKYKYKYCIIVDVVIQRLKDIERFRVGVIISMMVMCNDYDTIEYDERRLGRVMHQ